MLRSSGCVRQAPRRSGARRFGSGDVLLVTKLDRLARSTRDLLNILTAIAEKRAGFRSLGDSWADTTTAHDHLMLTVLGGLAEFERDLIRARTSEGRARAVANGVKLGRSRPLRPTNSGRPSGVFVRAKTISRLPWKENRGPGVGPMMPPGARTRRPGAFYDLKAASEVDGHPRRRGLRS
jgi:hypothetical protein